MEEGSLKKLRAKASMALRNSDFEAALASYRELAQREPRNPIWPQRRGEVYAQQEQHTLAIEQFEHALGITINNSQIIFAIAICKQILAIDPDHEKALDRLHLLYAEAEPSQASPDPTPAPVNLDPKLEDQPLAELMLTEALPGAGPDVSSDLDNSGVFEIPLSENVQSVASVPKAAPEVSGAREQLLNTPLFGSLDAASMRALIKRVKLVSLDEGEVLFRQGDPADTLYVVASGAVVPIAEEDARKKLAVLESGAFFGEIGLMTNQPRNATIQAIVESRLLAIDRKAMWALIRRHPSVLEVMLRFLRDRLIDRLIRTNPLFGAFPAKQRPSIAKLFRFLEVRSGTRMIEQGQTAKDLFVLLAGSAQVIQMDTDSDKVLAELESGAIFGEMSLLQQAPAIAEVVASSKCWMLALSGERLLRLIEDNEQVEAIIEQMAEERREANRDKSPFEPFPGQESLS
jgi:cAMP-dependent protein kinase regulator